MTPSLFCFFFFFQAEDGIRDFHVTGVQTCALPISRGRRLSFSQKIFGCQAGSPPSFWMRRLWRPRTPRAIADQLPNVHASPIAHWLIARNQSEALRGGVTIARPRPAWYGARSLTRARTGRTNRQGTRSEGWRRSVYSGRAGSSWSTSWWRRASATRLPIPAARRSG